jgi:hypothetical protein
LYPVDDETRPMATAHRAHQVPPTASFVWSEIGPDAGEAPKHIIVRKEAERVAGAGEFWWGLSASLGISVEVMAQRNGGTLPVLFSKSRAPKRNRSVKYGFGMLGEAYFTPISKDVFPVM